MPVSHSWTGKWTLAPASGIASSHFQQQKREKGNEAHLLLKMTCKLISSNDFPINLATSLEWILDSLSLRERAPYSPTVAPTRAALAESLRNKCYITQAKSCFVPSASYVLGDE